MKLESNYAQLDDTFICQIGMLNRGDLIKYKKYNKTMTAWFWGPNKNKPFIIIRKSKHTFDNIYIENLVDKVKEKDLQSKLKGELNAY